MPQKPKRQRDLHKHMTRRDFLGRSGKKLLGGVGGTWAVWMGKRWWDSRRNRPSDGSGRKKYAWEKDLDFNFREDVMFRNPEQLIRFREKAQKGDMYPPEMIQKFRSQLQGKMMQETTRQYRDMYRGWNNQQHRMLEREMARFFRDWDRMLQSIPESIDLTRSLNDEMDRRYRAHRDHLENLDSAQEQFAVTIDFWGQKRKRLKQMGDELVIIWSERV